MTAALLQSAKHLRESPSAARRVSANAAPRPLDYAALLGEAAWAGLSPATRERFAQHHARFAGSMVLRASRRGRCVAALCRVIGSPLPPHSVKALDCDGGLVERLAMGLRMQLQFFARDGELHFVSTGYYLELPWSGWRLHFPAWTLPGRMHVVHRDLRDGSFRFTMTIRHRWLGELFHHDGVFRAIGA